ncbi:MAG: hypothetical protein ABIQ18_13725 [Umezawaea sp.]
MTWQEQLRQLDAAFAAGKVSADVYRRQRDDLLISAQGAQSPTPQQPQTAPDSNPFPAPFKWSPQQPQSGSSESTQFITPVGTPSEADRTQVVPNSGGQPPQGDAAERTQVVSNADRTQVVGGQQQGAPWQAQQGTPWGSDQNAYSPPWSGSDPEQQQWSGFNTQGPEVFDESGGGKGKVFAIVGIVVVVLAIAAGVYFFVNKSGGGESVASSSSQPAAPTTTTKPKPAPFGTLIVPEGRSAGPKTYTSDELTAAKPLPTPDLVVLKQVGATEARSVIVVENEITTSLWAFKVASPAGLQTAMNTDQQRFGFAEDPTAKQGDVVPYKSVQTSGKKSITVFRAHYVAGGEVIRVEVFGVDEAGVKSRFDAVFAEQLKHTAPTK